MLVLRRFLNSYANVPRALLEVAGSDANAFLNGIVTNDLRNHQRGSDALFAAFLSPQGRILYDVFLYPRNIESDATCPSYIIEVAADMLSSLQLHLRRYILRAKITVVDVTDQYRVWSVWGPDVSLLWRKNQTTLNSRNAGDIGCFDPRWPDPTLRLLLPTTLTPSLSDDFSQVTADEYHLRRYLNGIPEGPLDFFSGVSLPLESNLDYMNGVNFRKGCYVGQELTIRTYHTGVTRKRIVPVQLLNNPSQLHQEFTLGKSLHFTMPSSQSDIFSSPTLTDDDNIKESVKLRPIGKFCSGMHNVGLALMRLEHITPHSVFSVANSDVWVRPFLPSWWPQSSTDKFTV